jgi:zinc protease
MNRTCSGWLGHLTGRSAHLGHTVALLAATALAGPAFAADEEAGGPEVIDVKVPAGRAPRPDLNVRVPNFELDTTVFTFPTGLRVMFQRDVTQPIVAITAVTDHGASDDPLGKEGIAHLVEHLWFRSEQGELPKTWDVLEAEMGCDLNAFTQYDITAYMTVCASNNLEAMMKLESLRITDTVVGVTEEMVTVEADVVRNEIRMRAENYNIPFFTYWEYVNGHLYAEDHPYHRPMAGNHTTIRNCKLADIQKFTEDYYRPDTTTIMVVGDFPSDDPAYLLHLLVSTFDLKLLHPDLTDDDIRLQPRPGITRPDPNNPEHWYMIPVDPNDETKPINYQSEIPVRATEFADLLPPDAVTQELGEYIAPVEKDTVVVAWTMPPGYQDDELVIDFTGRLLNVVIGNNTAVIEAVGGDFQGCGAIPSKRSTLALCIAERKKKGASAEQIAQKMLDQVSLLYAAPDGDADQIVAYGDSGGGSLNYRALFDFWFSRIRQEYLADTLRSLDLYAAVGAGRATDIAQHAHFTGSPRFHSEKMEEVMRLESYQVAELAERWLRRERATMVLLTPIDREELEKSSSDTPGAGGHYRGGGEGGVLKPSMDVNLITPEFIEQVVTVPDRSRLDDFLLPNGLRVVIYPHSDAPVARATLIAQGGSVHDVTGALGLSSYAIEEEQIDALRIAGEWSGGTGRLTQQLAIKGSAGNLDGMLWMLRQRVESRKPMMSLKSSWLDGQRDALKKDWRDREWHQSDLMFEHVNPGHPVHHALNWSDLEALKKISSKDISANLADVWRPDNLTLLIVGRVDPREARTQVVRYFGGWRAPEGVAKRDFSLPPPPNEPLPTAIQVFHDKGKTQTTVTMVCQLQANPDPVAPEYDLLGDITRMNLFTTLREEAGIVYSPQVAVISRPGGNRYLYMTADIQNDSSVFAMEQYIAYTRKVEAGQSSAADLRVKQLAMANGFVLGQQSIDQMSSRLADTLSNQLPWTTWDTFAKRLSMVTTDDLARITKGCVDHAYISFSGPEEQIMPLLDAGKYTYEVVDWKQRGKDMFKIADPKGFARDEKKRQRDGEDEDEDEDEDE